MEFIALKEQNAPCTTLKLVVEMLEPMEYASLIKKQEFVDFYNVQMPLM